MGHSILSFCKAGLPIPTFLVSTSELRTKLLHLFVLWIRQIRSTSVGALPWWPMTICTRKRHARIAEFRLALSGSSFKAILAIRSWSWGQPEGRIQYVHVWTLKHSNLFKHIFSNMFACPSCFFYSFVSACSLFSCFQILPPARQWTRQLVSRSLTNLPRGLHEFMNWMLSPFESNLWC